MHINKSEGLARRAFLKRAAHLGLAGVAAPWAMNLAAIGEAAAFTASDYKALVCVFLYGGNDHANMLIPADNANYTAYNNIRKGDGTAGNPGIARTQASLAGSILTPLTALPGGMQLALAPEMGGLKSLFDAGKLAVQLNVGPLIMPTTLAQFNARSVPLPPKLFSHNDQQSTWQSSAPEGAVRGWGGRLGDLALANNVGNDSVFTCISVTGNAVYLAGDSAVQYQVSTGGAVAISSVKSGSLYGSSSCGAALRTLVQQASGQLLESEYATVTSRSISSETRVAQALAGSSALTTVFNTTGNSLASQLQMVARLISARASLGVKRQVFMVSLGGFDLHDDLAAKHPALLANVSDAMNSFYKATEEMGVQNSVTTFTASDFGRTLSSNGDGADHGWGSHHFVMGGAVNGKNFYGQAPAIAVGGTGDVGQGRLLPTTSVDQFAATMARWFGVADSDLGLVVPNIGNYTQRNMGFV